MVAIIRRTRRWFQRLKDDRAAAEGQPPYVLFRFSLLLWPWQYEAAHWDMHQPLVIRLERIMTVVQLLVTCAMAAFEKPERDWRRKYFAAAARNLLFFLGLIQLLRSRYGKFRIPIVCLFRMAMARIFTAGILEGVMHGERSILQAALIYWALNVTLVSIHQVPLLLQQALQLDALAIFLPRLARASCDACLNPGVAAAMGSVTAADWLSQYEEVIYWLARLPMAPFLLSFFPNGDAFNVNVPLEPQGSACLSFVFLYTAFVLFTTLLSCAMCDHRKKCRYLASVAAATGQSADDTVAVSGWLSPLWNALFNSYVLWQVASTCWHLAASTRLCRLHTGSCGGGSAVL